MHIIIRYRLPYPTVLIFAFDFFWIKMSLLTMIGLFERRTGKIELLSSC